MLSFRQSVFVMKMPPNKILSVTTPNKERFVIGFQDAKLASHVRRNLHPTKNPILERQYRLNVAKDVKAAMLELSLPIFDVSDKIMVDVAANLYIPKADIDTYDDYEAEVIDTADFLMMPFNSDVGVVMPGELQYEDHEKFVLSSYVIERAKSDID